MIFQGSCWVEIFISHSLDVKEMWQISHFPLATDEIPWQFCGNFFPDYYQDRDEEAYEDWVERIRCERRSKYWQNVPQSSTSGRANQTEEDRESREFQKKLEQDHERYQEKMKKKMQERKQKSAVLKKTFYEQKWTDLFSEIKNGTLLSFSDIPWPDGVSKSADAVLEFLFCDFDEEETTLRKKYLRSQQVRWHPDKFMQKFGQNLLETDREKILEKVKSVSQLMNQITDNMSR
jgi:NF-kappa-B inhibitor-like protein 1